MKAERPAARLRALLLAAILLPSIPLTLPSATAAPSGPQPLAINISSFAGTQYLIVTPSAYLSIMQSIADWKTQKGVPAQVVGLEGILSAYSGRDDAEKLHNFLQDVYFNGTSQGLKFVLLGGGASLVPIRYLHTEGSVITFYTHDDVFSDVYYAGLDSNWDTNNNGVYGEYGEEDWDANVYVGRLPFRDASQAQAARDNLLNYEKNPDVGPWMRQVLAFASVMDPPNNMPGPNITANIYDWWEDNAIRSVWNTEPFIPSRMPVNLLADYYELYGGNYTKLQDGLSNASMVAALAGGASVVISVTHGWVPSGKGVPEYEGNNGVDYTWGQGLTYLNASGLTNTGRLAAGYFSSCLVGNFSNTDLPNLASFMLLQNRGFIAVVVPTDGTLRGEDDYFTLGIREGNWWQSENFWKNFFTGPDPYRMGPALYQGIRDYSQHIRDVGRPESWGGYRTQKAVYNLMGDPEVPIWTDVAIPLNASLPAQLYAAPQHLRATYEDLLGRPVAGLTVAVTGQGVYATATTDAQGKVDMIVAPATTGSLLVTASGANALPSQVIVPVVTAPADLSLDPSDVQLATPNLRAGTTSQISIRVFNLGQLASNATTVAVDDTPPGGSATLVGSPVTLPDLGPGQSITLTVDWAPVGDGVHRLHVTVDPGGLVYEFDELNNEVTREVPVSSVDLSLDASALVFEPSGNVAAGGSLRVSGPIGRAGTVPRSYLIGYELADASGHVVDEGNLPASVSQSSFSFAVPVASAGDYTLTLKADLEDVVLEFNETNNVVSRDVHSGTGPTLYQLPTVNIDEDAPATTVVSDLRAYVTDPDTPFEALLFTATPSNAGLTVWVQGSSLVVLPAANYYGSGTITLEATDGPHSSAVLTSFVVNPVNDAPVVAPLQVPTGRVGQPFVMRVNATDADGDPLTYSSQTPGATINGSTGVMAFIPDASMVGTTLLQVTVSDGTSSVQVSGALIVMPANHAPSLVKLGPFTIVRGRPSNFQLVARDPDGDPVTFVGATGSLVVGPTGAMSLTADGTRALGPGTYHVQVTVTDGMDASVSTVDFVVEDATAGTNSAGAERQEATAIALISIACVAAALGIILAQRRRPVGPA